MAAAAIVGSAVVGGVMSSRAQKKAAGAAGDAQAYAAELGIDESRRQFDAIQALLKPYVDAGGPALSGQQSLIGLNGQAKQQEAIDALENSPEFESLVKTGESSILQNASATGGLRGGNVQAALAKFRPSVLSELITQQFDRLGGLTQLGQNSAVMQGNAGFKTGENISKLFGEIGSARAGTALGIGKADAGMWSMLGDVPGHLAGLKGVKF